MSTEFCSHAIWITTRLTQPLNGELSQSVYADGGICLDILQNQWSPIYDVAAILTSIQVRLCLNTLVSNYHYN